MDGWRPAGWRLRSPGNARPAFSGSDPRAFPTPQLSVLEGLLGQNRKHHNLFADVPSNACVGGLTYDTRFFRPVPLAHRSRNPISCTATHSATHTRCSCRLQQTTSNLPQQIAKYRYCTSPGRPPPHSHQKRHPRGRLDAFECTVPAPRPPSARTQQSAASAGGEVQRRAHTLRVSWGGPVRSPPPSSPRVLASPTGPPSAGAFGSSRLFRGRAPGGWGSVSRSRHAMSLLLAACPTNHHQAPAHTRTHPRAHIQEYHTYPHPCQAPPPAPTPADVEQPRCCSAASASPPRLPALNVTCRSRCAPRVTPAAGGRGSLLTSALPAAFVTGHAPTHRPTASRVLWPPPPPPPHLFLALDPPRRHGHGHP